MSWWIAALSMQGVTAEVDVLFKSLQAKQLLIRQQLALLDDFVSRLKELASVIGPLSDAQIGAFGTDNHPRFMSPVNAGSVFGLSVDNIVAFLKGQGSFIRVEYEKLDAESVASLIDSFGTLFVEFASGVTNIRPQRDDCNVGIHGTPLPCLPLSFCKMREDQFIALVVQMQSRLKSKFTANDIDALESKHQEFRRGIRGEAALKGIIDVQTDAMSFDEGWGGGLNERFPLLCEFAGGLALAYSGKARIESDFSILGIEKNVYRTSLMNLSFDGIMHTKQFMELQALVT